MTAAVRPTAEIALNGADQPDMTDGVGKARRADAQTAHRPRPLVIRAEVARGRRRHGDRIDDPGRKREWRRTSHDHHRRRIKWYLGPPGGLRMVSSLAMASATPKWGGRSLQAPPVRSPAVVLRRREPPGGGREPVRAGARPPAARPRGRQRSSAAQPGARKKAAAAKSRLSAQQPGSPRSAVGAACRDEGGRKPAMTMSIALREGGHARRAEPASTRLAAPVAGGLVKLLGRAGAHAEANPRRGARPLSG